MAIMESIEFSYDGKYSSDFGIYNVSIDGGLFEETFTATRSILETKIRGNDKPYFNGIEYEPITLSLSFAFIHKWDDNKIREIARWLCGQSYYKPLWFVENPTRIFYCMSVDDSQLVHNGLKEGYITLTFRCDSPYTYSPVYTKGVLDFSTITEPTSFTFVNEGDIDLKPEMWIEKIENGDVSIINTTNQNREFKFTGLTNGETVFIDNESQHIETDIPLTYRFSNFNNKYLTLVRGVNNLVVTGRCKISFRYQFKTLQG